MRALGIDSYSTLPLEIREVRLEAIQQQITQRWCELEEHKKVFAPYKKKSGEEIIEEFHQLDTLRNNLWYRDGNILAWIYNKNYKIFHNLLPNKHFKESAFAYNHAHRSYDASLVLLRGYLFIALQEPNQENLDIFLKILTNYEVSILVRLKPEGEYREKGSLSYWRKRIIEDQNYLFIQLDSKQQEGPAIPYFYTNHWIDDKAMDIEELYRLVKGVQKTYRQLQLKGPIAAHCATGIGRTGTFIAAFTIAEILEIHEPEELSIEEIVLQLSIQRRRMVANAAQYLLLYQFVDYYLAKNPYFE